MAQRWQHGSPSSAAQLVLASDGAAQPSSLPGGAAQPTLLSDGAEQPMLCQLPERAAHKGLDDLTMELGRVHDRALSGPTPVSVMTQYNGQMNRIEVQCFNTVVEVKCLLWNAFVRRIGEPGDQMTSEEFSCVSHKFELTVCDKQYQSREQVLESDDEIVDKVNGNWFLSMTQRPQHGR